MLRKTLLFLAIAWLGCSAAPQQATSGDLAQSGPADLSRRVERTVRSEFKIPAYVKISIGSPKPSEFANFDNITVTFTTGDKKQTHEFFVSKDGKQLVDMRKMDMTVDPYQKAMAKIDLTGRPPRGNKDAKVTVVVYDDYQCPFCSRMHQELFSLMKELRRPREGVLQGFSPASRSILGRAARRLTRIAWREQNGEAFWDFADYMHANGRQISGEKKPFGSPACGCRPHRDGHWQQAPPEYRGARAVHQRATLEGLGQFRQGSRIVGGECHAFYLRQRPEGRRRRSRRAEFKAILDQALRDAGQQPPAATSASAASAGK